VFVGGPDPAVGVTDELTFRRVGDRAMLVELGSRARAAAAYRIVRRLVDRDPSLAVDVVPAATTVLLDGIADARRWRDVLTQPAVDAALAEDADVGAVEPVVIRVRYDGVDLEDVAETWGCSPREAVERHAAADFTVAFCGFAPGFAYCTSDPPLQPVPRRPEPRARVPAGSVALASEYCGVYPRAMPGGWQLIGTTDAVLFDARRDQPALLSPGAPVRFEPR
jgi:KipI family sensor histidine kinase inhibitor